MPQIRSQTIRHPLMNLVNTTLSQKYGVPYLKVSIYGSVLKSSLYISLIPGNDSKLTPISMVLCGLLSLCAQFHTRPLPLFGRVKSVGSYPLSLRLQCKCFRKIISRSRRPRGDRTRSRPQRLRIFPGALYFPGRALALSSSVAGGDLNTVAVQGYSEKFCESF